MADTTAGTFSHSCAQLGLCQGRTPQQCPDCPDTTRRYPRTLEQAFPESEGYRFAFHGPFVKQGPVAAVCRWLGRLGRRA